MSGRQEVPSESVRAPLEPGVRAARKRLRLSQKQAAQRMNASIHSFRRWDQGRGQPGDAETMQMVAIALKTPIHVLWPPTNNPHVAQALAARERDLVAGEETGNSVPGGARGDPELGPVVAVNEAVEEASAQAKRSAEVLPVPADPGDFTRQPGVDPAPQTSAESPADLPADAGVCEFEVEDTGLRGSEPVRDLPGAPIYDDLEDGPGIAAQTSAHAADTGIGVLNGARSPTRLSWRRAVATVMVAVALGVGAMIAAAAVDGRHPDAKRAAAVTTREPSSKETERRQAAAARQQSETQMEAAGQRGDFNAAIALARRLNDQAALDGYREAAAQVLVRRAAKAAGRGDLPLARSRLQRAESRYTTTPGAKDVRARIRRVEQQRAARAKQRRVDARLAKERRAAAVRAQRAAADSPTAPSTTSTASSGSPPATSAQSSSQPATSGAPRSSSTSPKSSGRSSSKDPEKAVDPGLF